MRTVAAAFVALALAWAPCTARAADLSGVWAVDRAAWEGQLERMLSAMLARMPSEAAEQMRAAGVDPAAAFKAAAAEGLDATVEFLPGGVVRTTDPADGATEDGKWTLTGDELRIVVEDAEGLEAMVGKVDGDRIELRPIIEGDDPDTAFMREMTYPLVRRP
jgi:hypothetical protein